MTAAESDNKKNKNMVLFFIHDFERKLSDNIYCVTSTQLLDESSKCEVKQLGKFMVRLENSERNANNIDFMFC